MLVEGDGPFASIQHFTTNRSGGEAVPMQAIKDLNAQHRFRDPVCGFIKATDAEMKIIDTPVFQRLRRIHQLALTKYVYPGAEYSRFVYSEGVDPVSVGNLIKSYGSSLSWFVTYSPKTGPGLKVIPRSRRKPRRGETNYRHEKAL